MYAWSGKIPSKSWSVALFLCRFSSYWHFIQSCLLLAFSSLFFSRFFFFPLAPVDSPIHLFLFEGSHFFINRSSLPVIDDDGLAWTERVWFPKEEQVSYEKVWSFKTVGSLEPRAAFSPCHWRGPNMDSAQIKRKDKTQTFPQKIKHWSLNILGHGQSKELQWRAALLVLGSSDYADASAGVLG